MNTFDMNFQVEEISTYLITAARSVFDEWYKACEKNFLEGLELILEYKQLVCYDLYVEAVQETYENASEDMTEYMRMIDINSYKELLIYIDGFERGLKK